ncbi:hypothetical protein EDB87DRAFT_1416352 [Lactarius vividus]|nr:hypothetical protein EDB87DRAFT_1416352 [Lactarius vividus]
MRERISLPDKHAREPNQMLEVARSYGSYSGLGSASGSRVCNIRSANASPHLLCMGGASKSLYSRLALIRLGQIGADRAANLKYDRDMIRKAANSEGTPESNMQGKPELDLIVLPECFIWACKLSHLRRVHWVHKCDVATSRARV